MPAEYRFQGAMSADYRWIRLTIPGFEELQTTVREVIARYQPGVEGRCIEVLEIGCGDGVTSAMILSSRSDCVLTALDSEATMLQQATVTLQQYLQDKRCRLLLRDAVAYVSALPAGSVDIVASALCLHNMERRYRDALQAEILRALRRGGMFVNADKYAAGEEQRFEALHVSLDKMFEIFVPLEKLELLRACVLHNVADQAPDRVLWQEEEVTSLRQLGFADVAIRYRDNQHAVLVAMKPPT